MEASRADKKFQKGGPINCKFWIGEGEPEKASTLQRNPFNSVFSPGAPLTNFNDRGVQQSFIFYTPKNHNFRICLPKKITTSFSIPKKNLNPFFTTPNKPSCFFCNPKNPSNFHRPKYHLWPKFQTQKNHSDPPPLPWVFFICFKKVDERGTWGLPLLSPSPKLALELPGSCFNGMLVNNCFLYCNHVYSVFCVLTMKVSKLLRPKHRITE